MARVLIVDDHPAIRVGLTALLRGEPGLTPVAVAGTAREGLRKAGLAGQDLMLVDYELPDGNGLLLCRDIKQAHPRTKVVLYSAFARPALWVAAALAGVDGMLDKSVAPATLLETLRLTARGADTRPTITPQMLQGCAGRLGAREKSILGMSMTGVSVSEIASVLKSDEARVEEQLRTMLVDLTA